MIILKDNILIIAERDRKKHHNNARVYCKRVISFKIEVEIKGSLNWKKKYRRARLTSLCWIILHLRKKIVEALKIIDGKYETETGEWRHKLK
jgi:hypothetical protein